MNAIKGKLFGRALKQKQSAYTDNGGSMQSPDNIHEEEPSRNNDMPPPPTSTEMDDGSDGMDNNNSDEIELKKMLLQDLLDSLGSKDSLHSKIAMLAKKHQTGG